MRRPVPACSCLSTAFVPVCRLTRRAWIGTAMAVVATGCSKAPRWATTSVEAKRGIVEIDIKDHPELVTPGGMTAFEPEGFGKDPVLVMRVEGDAFRVMSLRCPHIGCTVRWDNEAQLLVCPCHGSRFDDTGRVLEGPAKTNLASYAWALDGTRLQIRVPED